MLVRDEDLGSEAAYYAVHFASALGCIFYNRRVCSNSVTNNSTGAIFFESIFLLCLSLVILTEFQIFLLLSNLL